MEKYGSLEVLGVNIFFYHKLLKEKYIVIYIYIVNRYIKLMVAIIYLLKMMQDGQLT